MLSFINSFIVSTVERSGVPVPVLMLLWFALWVCLLVILPPKAKKGFYSYNTKGRLAGVAFFLLSPLLFIYALYLLWRRVVGKVLGFTQE